MNKKGQSLIVFVLILPIIIFFLAMFIDVSMMYLNQNKDKAIIKDNMKVALNNNIRDKEKLIDTIKENDKDIKIDIVINDDNMRVIAEKTHESIFGNIFKLDIYKLKVNYCANYQDKKIKEC